MAKALPSKRGNEAVFGSLENILASTFEPVSPRPAYVKDLNRRLSNYPSNVPEIVDPNQQRNSLGLILGMLAGVGLVFLSIRWMRQLIADRQR
jgi:hypothetical protein